MTFQRIWIVNGAEDDQRLVLWSEGELQIGAFRVTRPRPRQARIEAAMVAEGAARMGGVHAVVKMGMRAAQALNDLPIDRLQVAVKSFGDVLRPQGFKLKRDAWEAPTEEIGAPLREMADEGVFADQCERRIYSRGDIVFRRGRRAAELCVVARGSLRLVGVDRNGDPREVALLGPGELLGEELLAGGDVRPLHAVAHAHQLDLLCVDARRLPALLRRPTVRRWVDNALVARMRRLTARVVDGDEPELTERLARILYDHATSGEQDQAACPIGWLSAQAGTTPLSTRRRLGDLWSCVSLMRDVAVVHDVPGLERWLEARAAVLEMGFRVPTPALVSA